MPSIECSHSECSEITDTVYTIDNNVESQSETNQINDLIDSDNDVLAKHTILIETQKCALKKGLKFIPKPKQLPIQALRIQTPRGAVWSIMHSCVIYSKLPCLGCINYNIT